MQSINMKNSKLTLLIFPFFLIICLHNHVAFGQLKPDYAHSPFGFLKDLQGSQKGSNSSSVADLKNYLTKFGYLGPQRAAAATQATPMAQLLSTSKAVEPVNTIGSNLDLESNPDLFDDGTEAAIRKFQRRYNLNVTGTLDKETVSTMIKPRCAMADPSIMNVPLNGSGPAPPPYRYFPGNPKWPTTNFSLTYAFADNCTAALKYAVRESLKTWQRLSPFKFVHSDDYFGADLKFSYERGDHGDNNPFDGPGGVYAHAFAPPLGVLHFDVDEDWTMVTRPNTVDLYTITLHEIGHSLGLDHTPDKDSIMYPYIAFGEIKHLHDHDILGIKNLYGV